MDSLNGQEYAVSDVGKSWFDALADCQTDGATLAVIETEEEQRFLYERFINESM